jgi:hypothetical protein
VKAGRTTLTFRTAPVFLLAVLLGGLPAAAAPRYTVVTIAGESFLFNGDPTFHGRTWQGHRVEGLLPNARLVQGIFDDLNPATRGQWAYPDTGRWDAERNTSEFIAAMPDWRRHGLLAFTLNLQGGSPYGYSKAQPWHNSAFAADGRLRADYLARLARILDRADELGMAVILGLYYFGQDERLGDEAAVRRGVAETVQWVLAQGYTNVLLEIANETGPGYDHPILRPDRVAELITYARSFQREGRRLLCSVSYRGGVVPSAAVAQCADFLLLHGNGVADPAGITRMVAATRALPGAAAKPVVFNEDDHFAFDRPDNNFLAALRAHASWGYFDYRMKDEPFGCGFQSVPADWRISSDRKRAFFSLLQEVTGQP